MSGDQPHTSQNDDPIACRICGERTRSRPALDGLCSFCGVKREVYLAALLVGRYQDVERSKETWRKHATALVEMAEIVVECDRGKRTTAKPEIKEDRR